MNTGTIIIIAIFGVLGIIGGVYLVVKRLLSIKKPEDGQLLMLQNQLNEITRALDTKLGESHQATQAQFERSITIIRDVTEKLTKLDETNKQVINFADQLKNLQDILKNPKQRGVLGEYYLETVLENVFAPNPTLFKMQYEFPDGTIVDAVVFVKDKIIPIDSKFSLENYNRLISAKSEEEKEYYENAFVQDLKNRIDETSKYVKPENGTMEFAFMFIPSEAVYYDLVINKVGAIKSNTRDLVNYAAEKRVTIVSPTTFFAYLQTILQGLKALQIEESAKEIRHQVENLSRHLSSYETYIQKLGDHLGKTVGAYNSAYKEFGKVDKDVLKITGSGFESDVKQIEKPSHQED
jgi:DNA recombination protein RmuC